MCISRRRGRLRQQLRTWGTAGARVMAAVAGVSATVVLGAVAVGLARSPIVLPVLPPQPLVHYPSQIGFFNGVRRPVYRHSVVPGGVYSAEELEAAMLRDPVVAAHYARLDSSRIVATVLDQPRALYVSYRVGQRTGWTSQKIMLPAGERLLTDGTRAVRARCGNLVSDTGGEPAVAGASGERIEPAEFDQLAPPVVADLLPAGGTPVLIPAGTPEPAPFFQPVPGVLPFVLAGDEPRDSDEPGTPGLPPGHLTTTTTGVIVPPTTTTGLIPPTTTITTGVFPPTTTTPTTPRPTTSSVPEPARLALLVLAWVAFRYSRRPR